MTPSLVIPSMILAIDQGGQSSRVAIYTANGEQLYCFSSNCATQINEVENTAQRFIEQDPENILAGIRDCLEKIQTVFADNLSHICALGFAGQGSSLLCWDSRSGDALTPVLSWQDTRGEYYLRDFPLSHKQVQALTGLRISPHYGASKMRWCIEHYPEVALALSNNSLSIGPIVSYIFWHLLQKENLVDPGHAQRTLLWNISDNNWDSSLLHIFNIPTTVLPKCVYHNSYFGDLAFGNHKIPVVASARDQGASLFSRGMPDKNACYINIGTGAFIQRVSEKVEMPEGLLLSPLWLPEKCEDAKLYAWEATVNGAASAMQYLQQETGLDVTPAQINYALTLNPEKNCYLLNGIGGLSAPYWRTDLQSRFSENLTAEEKILAWLESVVFQIVVNVELMAELGAIQKIYISGGLSNADMLCQKIADLTCTRVYRSDNTDATLQGIAYLAAGMPAQWKPPIKDDVFNSQHNIATQLRFAAWREQMEQWLQ